MSISLSGGRSLLFATGGTGGHIYPALAIAKEATQRAYATAFLGQAGGMEARILPAEGFSFHGVAAGKWDRQRPNPLQGVRAVQGLGQAVNVVRKLKPDLVVGFGGFASFPGLAAARLLGVPYLLHEGNAFPGRVTRLFAKGAARVAVTHAAAGERLGALETIRLTGFPVREQKVQKLEARRRLGLPPEGTLTFVMGGSQGSLVLNEIVPEAFRRLASPTTVLHSTGRRWEAQVQNATLSFSSYFTSGFVDATLAWSAADLAITRAGISTLSEAAFHGVPSIMVPLPSAADNHQFYNARAVETAGAGWLVEEAAEDTAKDTMIPALASAWQNALVTERRQAAARAAVTLSPQGAARAFVDLIDEVLAPTPLFNGLRQEY